MKNGTYAMIMKKWGLENNMLTGSRHQPCRKATAVTDRTLASGSLPGPDAAELRLRDVAHARRPINYTGWILWVVTILVAADFSLDCRSQQELRMVCRRAVVYGQNPSCRGLSVTLGLTVVAMLIGVVIGLVSGDCATFRHPSSGGVVEHLHLVLPRHAAAGPADFLVQPLDLVPGRFPSASLSARNWSRWNTNDLITPIDRGDRRAGAE